MYLAGAPNHNGMTLVVVTEKTIFDTPTYVEG